MLIDNLDKNEYRRFLRDTVIKGQKCQRNWDLSKQIPQEDLDIIIHAATQCPSKQNLDFYSLLVIQNQEIQKKIYRYTWTRPNKEGRLNPQVLANTLLIFLPNEPYAPRNNEMRAKTQNTLDDDKKRVLRDDMHQAVGVAAGFVNVVAQSLGYSTGCNKCFDSSAVKAILKTEQHPLLMMGIGYKDENRNRRVNHVTGNMIESFKKLPITVEYITE
jgi:nitroreductase